MKRVRQRWSVEDIPPLTGKTAIVTGASSGLGAVVATQLATRGAHVTLAVRRAERGAEVAERLRNIHEGASVTVGVVDVADLASITTFARDWTSINERLDILVNNAGVMGMPRRQETVDGFEAHFGTNHLGAFALTRALLGTLAQTPGARVVAVASNAHRHARLRLDDLMSTRAYSPFGAYARSKLANLLFTSELQRRFERAGIDAIAVAAHPGWASTGITRGAIGQREGVARALERAASLFGALSPDVGALSILYAATAPDVTGDEYIGPDGPGEIRGYPTRARRADSARDPLAAAELWRACEDLTGGAFL